MAMHYRLGVDLGGTKIEIVALDADGRERLRTRVPAPRDDYDATLAAVADLVREAERCARCGGRRRASASARPGRYRARPASCAARTPSASTDARCTPISRRGSDARCASPTMPTASRCPRRIDGAGGGSAVVFGAILGTGVGAGIVVEGKVLDGRNAIAGEWGHNPLPWPEDDERPGPACWCGRAGCIETWLAGPSCARDHAARTGIATAEPAQIVGAAAAGDRRAERSLARYEHRLARALAHVVNLLDPDVIVLGGGMSNIERLYANVPRLWGRWIFSDRVDTRLVRHRHGDSSGVRGAARLWPAP